MIYLSVILLLVTIISCSGPELASNGEEFINKISFDLETLNDEGLYGPPDGLRALDYKFCIPKNERYKNEVMQIDPGLKVYDGNSSPQTCDENQYLCVGNTHQKNFKQILLKLAALDYVKQIDKMSWE